MLLLCALKVAHAGGVDAITEQMVSRLIHTHDSLLLSRDAIGVQRNLGPDFEFTTVKKDGSLVRLNREQFIDVLSDFSEQGDYRRTRSSVEYRQVSPSAARYTSSLSESIEVDGVMRHFDSVESYKLEMGEDGPMIIELTVFER